MNKIYSKNKIFSGTGFTIIEIMVTVLCLALISGGAFSLFKSTIKTSDTGTRMMDYYQRSQKILMRLSRDIKEANYVHDEAPVMVAQNKVAALGISPETQKLEIIKQIPDFTKEPTGADKHIEFKTELITYKVEPMQTIPNKFKLMRKAGDKSDELVGDNLDELMFYRIDSETPAGNAGGKPTYGAGPKTIYVKIKMLVP
ncbi:MAG TPA: hypothetical protein PKK26_02955, partial [Candidatus Wallbacteria bacterium]|nr:hypothetical protein [Candidatus Wallbacteria bacterium]